MEKDKQIEEHILEAPVAGVNLSRDRLGEELGSEPVLLVFLRHLG